jgi:hypothetical protein
VLATVVQFLEGFVHNVLYKRLVYPPTVFQRVNLFDVMIHYSLFEKLNRYIRDSLAVLIEDNWLLGRFACLSCPMVNIEMESSAALPCKSSIRMMYRWVRSSCSFEVTLFILQRGLALNYSW